MIVETILDYSLNSKICVHIQLEKWATLIQLKSGHLGVHDQTLFDFLSDWWCNTNEVIPLDFIDVSL